MKLSQSSPMSNPKAFVFGSQAIPFTIESFNSLSIELKEAAHYQWILDAVATLPSDWNSIFSSVPKLQHSKGKKQLEDLNEWLRGGEVSQSSFPLPNVLLSPLVVIVQLTQYSAFIKSALPDLSDTDELPASLRASTETLGLCTGMLSAFAAACSSSLVELQQNGAVALRLAMLIGALVDVDDVSPDSEGESTSFSVSWNSAESEAAVKELLKRYPEVNIN